MSDGANAVASKDGDVPDPKTGLAAWLGRPVHLEARAPYELRRLQRSPMWRGEEVPEGRGRPLLIIAGFLSAPRSSRALHHIMSMAGWDAVVASVGRNSGPAYTAVDAATADLRRLEEKSGQQVTIVGHSRGGQFARILAVRHPDSVAQIVVAGTPLLVKYPAFAPVKVPAEVLDRAWRSGAFGPVFPDRESEVDQDRYVEFPSSVDFVSIFSKSDGIVDWRLSIEEAAHLIEVNSSHRGLINGEEGVQAIANALGRQDR